MSRARRLLALASFFAAFVASFALLPGSSASGQVEYQELIDANGEPGDVMGTSVDVHVDLSIPVGVAIVGAPEGNLGDGQVYIYRYDGFTWNFETEILNPSPNKHDDFGHSVAIEGDFAVVGAPHDDSQKGDAGRVYVFEHSAGTWSLVATLESPSSESGELGWSVDIEGGVVVAGAPSDDSGPGGNPGLVLIYEQPATGWADTSTAFELRPSDATTSDFFGFSVAISGGTVVAGAPDRRDASNGRGCLYVFEEPTTGWADGNEVATLEMSTHADDARLGLKVAIDGDRIVGGGRDEETGHGAVYLYHEPVGGWVDATETQRLESSRLGQIHYGDAVAIQGDLLVVGVTATAVGGLCAAYEWDGVTWGNEVEFQPASITSGDLFGAAVAISGEHTFIGAPFREPNDDDLRGAAFDFLVDPLTIAFTAYGSGPLTLAGTLGGPGDLTATVAVSGAAPSVLGLLGVSTASAPGTLVGGVQLWIDLAAPGLLLFPIVFDGGGNVQMQWIANPEFALGGTVYLQVLAQKLPRGLTYSNGLQLDVTP